MTPQDFRPDLYRGTAGYYEAFRLAYPAGLISDLAARTGADGTRRLLDLACGTGQVSFALRDRFAEIWAVDQEPGMIAVARQKAAAAGDADPLAVCHRRRPSNWPRRTRRSAWSR